MTKKEEEGSLVGVVYMDFNKVFDKALQVRLLWKVRFPGRAS